MNTSNNGGPSDRTPDSEKKPDSEWQRKSAGSRPRNIDTLSLKDKKLDRVKRFTIKRDADRPLQFDGTQLAAVESMNMAMRHIRIALYETKAGRFIVEFRSIDPVGVLNQSLSGAMQDLAQEPEGPPTKKVRPNIHKAAVFDSREGAIGWLRPGRLTDKLLEELGLMDPEFIE